MNQSEIQKVLPHRYPMLLVDDIYEIETGKFAKGSKCVSVNEPWCQGHFPDEPIFPGVLIIEAMAQVSGFLFYSEGLKDFSKVYLSRVSDIKFLKKIVPGDKMIIESRLTQRFDSFITSDCTVWVEEIIAAKGTIILCLE